MWHQNFNLAQPAFFCQHYLKQNETKNPELLEKNRKSVQQIKSEEVLSKYRNQKGSQRLLCTVSFSFIVVLFFTTCQFSSLHFSRLEPRRCTTMEELDEWGDFGGDALRKCGLWCHLSPSVMMKCGLDKLKIGLKDFCFHFSPQFNQEWGRRNYRC